MDHIKKFQELLEELFQFDAADLDFGIYRIMNYKRGVIKRFISEDLPRSISEELAQGALAGQTQAAKELEAAKKNVLEISDDAIDAAGNLIKYHDTKPGKEYLAALEKAKSAKGHEALEAAIYNHLYAFFSRYYQDGDFISKRRYSKRERYAIPYNGEEVTLYWANHDQYYIKTGEYFHRLHLESDERRDRAFQADRRRCGAEQRQGREALLPAAAGWDCLGRSRQEPDHSL